MLPLVMGSIEHRSEWLVLYGPFELPIIYNNNCKEKNEGIIFNPSDLLKYHIGLYCPLTDGFIFYLK